MKIAPVSADLLIKLGLGVLVLGGVYLAYSKATGSISQAIDGIKESLGITIDGIKQSIGETVDSVTGAPGRVLDWAATEADTRGAAIQSANAPQSPAMQEATGRTYSNPLMNNDGMDFGQLSG